MATSIVSGRVDTDVKERAGAYILAAGLTTGELINNLWTYVARTKNVPQFLEEPESETTDAFKRFMQMRAMLHIQNKDTHFPVMSNEELKEYLMNERFKDYEALS